MFQFGEGFRQRAGQRIDVHFFARFFIQMIDVDVVERRRRGHLVVNTVERGGEHRGERQIRIRGGVGEAEFRSRGFVASFGVARNANQRGAVGLRPADVDGRFVSRHQPFIGVHRRRADCRQRAGVFEFSCDKTICQFGKVRLVVGVEEEIVALLVEEGLVAVHPGAVDAKNRFGHERGDESVLRGDGFDGVFEGEDVIGGAERVFEAEINFMLP